MQPDDDSSAIAHTRAWVERAVVGLNLCPFAKAPLVRGQVRFVCCVAASPTAVREALIDEMRLLAAAEPSEIETTVLVAPNALGDFLDFNDFLDVADDALAALDLDGVLQVASFHPDYQFAGTAEDDLGNATNRSPHPTLQLLREASVERAVETYPDVEAIPERNVERLEALGADGWAALRTSWRA